MAKRLSGISVIRRRCPKGVVLVSQSLSEAVSGSGPLRPSRRGLLGRFVAGRRPPTLDKPSIVLVFTPTLGIKV